MMLAGWYDNTIVVGLAVGAPMAILGFLGWWRTRGLDADAKQVAEEVEKNADAAQAVKGLESLVKALQDDNKVGRDNQRRLEQRIEASEKRLNAVETGNNDLQVKNRKLEREISGLHAENKALRLENEALKGRVVELESGRNK